MLLARNRWPRGRQFDAREADEELAYRRLQLAIAADRWAGGIVFGLLMILFGLFSPVAADLGLALPPAFIVMLGGLAMLPVLQQAFLAAFKGQCPTGALVCFLVTVAGDSLLNVGAAFWGLVAGCLVSLVLERDAFLRRA